MEPESVYALYVTPKFLYESNFDTQTEEPTIHVTIKDAVFEMIEPQNTLFLKHPVQKVFAKANEKFKQREVEWITKIVSALLYCNTSTNDVLNYLSAVMLDGTKEDFGRQNLPQHENPRNAWIS